MVTVKRHRSGLSDSEYLELLKKLVKEQYDEPVEDFESQYFHSSAEVSFKRKAKMQEVKKLISDVKDFSKSLRNDIAAGIQERGEIRVGPFYIQYNNNKDIINAYLHEEITKSFAGKQGKIMERVNLVKDTRFSNKEWVKYFVGKGASFVQGNGKNIPKETFIDIIKFLQFVYQNPAFL